MMLRLLFFGTPGFAVPSLAALAASRHTVVGVVTQPDRRRGRGHRIAPEAVKRAAIAHGLPVLQPDRLDEAAFLAAVADLRADLGVVAAFGRILPRHLLDAPRLGLINVHASLLPRWRGAAPVHRAILAGDTRTGVTIMQLVEALDAGPILLAEETAIGPDETSVELSDRLAIAGASLLLRAINLLAAGAARERDQDDASATYAPRLVRSEGRLDWGRPAPVVHDHIRGLQPWPMAGAVLHGHRVHFLRSAVASTEVASASSGTIVAIEPDALVIAARPGAVRITEVQPEGRRAMTVRAFLGGRHVAVGDRLAPLPVDGP